MALKPELPFKNGWAGCTHHLVNGTSALVARSSWLPIRLFFSPSGINSALLLNGHGLAWRQCELELVDLPALVIKVA